MNKQIHRLNQNALVSLSNDDITEEKVKTNIFANPHTIFLAPTNSTVDIINNFVINVLFRDQRPLMIITNGLQNHMPIHRNMTVVITENRYSLSTFYFVTVIIYKQHLLLYHSIQQQKILLSWQFFLICIILKCKAFLICHLNVYIFTNFSQKQKSYI